MVEWNAANGAGSPPLEFKASAKSTITLTRKMLWVGPVIGLGIVWFTGASSGRALLLTACIMALFCGLIDLLLRRQIRPGKALVTLYADGIESTGFSEKLRWADIAGASVEMAGNAPTLQLQLRTAPGVVDRRSFWTGRNKARPAIVLTPFSAQDQEALFHTVQLRLQQVSPGMQLHNPLQEERVFRDEFKALAPHTWVTYALVALNVGVWCLMALQGIDVIKPSAEAMLQWGGNTAFNVQHGEAWRLLTATFLHSGLVHLAMNMFGLFVIGQTVERIYGHRVFLLVYLASGLLGSAFSLHFAALRGVSVGASGAVFGIAGALLVAVFQHRATLPKVFSKQMLSSMGFFLLYSLAQGLGKSGIDNAAHVGGLVAGVLMALILPERFNMARFVAQVKPRAALAAVAAAGLTFGMVALAPAATVDLQRAFAGNAAFERGAKEFDVAMKRLRDDGQQVQEKKLSAVALDARARTVHAPAFRQVEADLADVYLAPDDKRNDLLKEVRHISAVLAEALAMPSVLPAGASEPTPADPARMEILQNELKESSARLATLSEQAQRR